MMDKSFSKAREDPDQIGRAAFIMELRRLGVRDAAVLKAVEAVPRVLFLDAPHQDLAYADRALPIACGQTISQPSLVAMMTEALDIKPSACVLEIGTGSGYQTAILAHLAERVFSLERYRTLAQLARERHEALKIDNVTIQVGDGYEGWPAHAPYARIMVTAAAESVPQMLLDQLALGGIMVVPLGPPGSVQKLMRLVKTPQRIEQDVLTNVRFVPMVSGVAETL